MARHKNRKHYAGATGRISIDDLRRLGSAFMVQPKMDGAYCHVHLDRVGRIARISSRTGRDYDGPESEGLIGQFVGYPGAVLVGELTAHTDAGIREREEFGQPRVHLFDMAFGWDTQPLYHLPYAERRASLCRMQAELATHGSGQDWYVSRHGIRDKRTGWFTRKSYKGTALTPIVPQVRPDSCGELWDRTMAGELEGLVAVSQNAPLGRRSAKRKCKPTRTLDALVLDVHARTVSCLYGATTFSVSKGKRNVQRGDMLEIKHDGWYASRNAPRFPRIVRVRYDLMVAD